MRIWKIFWQELSMLSMNIATLFLHPPTHTHHTPPPRCCAVNTSHKIVSKTFLGHTTNTPLRLANKSPPASPLPPGRRACDRHRKGYIPFSESLDIYVCAYQIKEKEWGYAGYFYLSSISSHSGHQGHASMDALVCHHTAISVSRPQLPCSNNLIVPWRMLTYADVCWRRCLVPTSWTRLDAVE